MNYANRCTLFNIIANSSSYKYSVTVSVEKGTITDNEITAITETNSTDPTFSTPSHIQLSCVACNTCLF